MSIILSFSKEYLSIIYPIKRKRKGNPIPFERAIVRTKINSATLQAMVLSLPIEAKSIGQDLEYLFLRGRVPRGLHIGSVVPAFNLHCL